MGLLHETAAYLLFCLVKQFISNVYIITLLQMNNIYHLKKRKKIKLSTCKISPLPKSPIHHIHSFPTQTSTNENYSKISESSTNILDQISNINPFAVITQSNDLQQRLNEVYSIHKRSIESFHNSPTKKQKQKNFINKRTESQMLSNQFMKVIHSRYKGNRKRDKKMMKQLIRNRTVQDHYQDIETQLANQLISQTERQSKIFQQTKNHFQSFIENAGAKYIAKSGLNCNPNEVKLRGLKRLSERRQVCCRYKDQLQSYEITPAKLEYYDLNKDDFYTWLKGSNKAINTQKMKQEIDRQNIRNRYSTKSTNSSNVLNGNDLIYFKYFKSKGSRRILKSSFLGNKDKYS